MGPNGNPNVQNAERHECHRNRESHDQENDCHECETLHFKTGKVTFSHLVQLAEGSLEAKRHFLFDTEPSVFMSVDLSLTDHIVRSKN